MSLLYINTDITLDASNYFIVYYQAILDKNLTAAMEFNSLSLEQRFSYPDHHSDIDVSEVFGDDISIEVINALLRKPDYLDFTLLFSDARNPLATEKNIAIRENSYHQMQNYPLLNYCSSTNYLSLDNLLSVSYSKVISKE